MMLHFFLTILPETFGKTLKARQFVGVIETRSGIVIEILPKTLKTSVMKKPDKFS
jgi:5-methylcytosine-specific restriction endonuclease McrBC regulatory subunit McrC